jgi:hypothetical protein
MFRANLSEVLLKRLTVFAGLVAALLIPNAALALGPSSFADVSSGVVLIKATNCREGVASQLVV